MRPRTLAYTAILLAGVPPGTPVAQQPPGSIGDGGPATAADLGAPSGVAVDAAGNLYVSERAGHRVRRVDAATGVIRTYAGTGAAGSSGDGGPASAARLYMPAQLALDPAGNLYIADRGNHRVRRVDAVTHVITTVAGTGEAGFSGDGGPAISARLNGPFGVAVGARGDIYIADTENQRIRRVSAATGAIETVAGNGVWDFAGDGGPATSAALARPHLVAVLPDGAVLIGDSFNRRLRRVDPATGVITTVAGTGALGSGGDGGPATRASFGYFGGLAVAPDGSIIVSGVADHRVRRIDAATGIVATVAGSGRWDFGGDGGPALAASLHLPTGVALDPAGTIYVGDLWNGRVRRIDAATGTIATVAGAEPFAGSPEVSFHFHYHPDSVRLRLDAPVALPPGPHPVERRELAFGDVARQTADLYLPDRPAAGPAPVVVLVHGRNDGEFPARTWGGLASWASLLASHGFAAVVFEHRLGSRARSLDLAAADLEALLDALLDAPPAGARAPGAAPALDPGRVCLLAFDGGSTLLAPALEAPPPGIRCLLAFSPHTALHPPALWDWFSEPREVRDRYTPGRRITRRSPPLFLAAGRGDRPAITDPLAEFVSAARAAGVAVELAEHPAGGAGFERLVHDEPSREILRSALAFLRRHLAP